MKADNRRGGKHLSKGLRGLAEKIKEQTTETITPTFKPTEVRDTGRLLPLLPFGGRLVVP